VFLQWDCPGFVLGCWASGGGIYENWCGISQATERASTFQLQEILCIFFYCCGIVTQNFTHLFVTLLAGHAWTYYELVLI
jgi:hypothetical protein